MKILTIKNTFFKLPERFKGSVSDALRMLAEYLETDTKPLKPETKTMKDDWDDFLDTMGRGGKLRGQFTVQSLSQDRKKWDVQEDPGKNGGR